ncbi:hypothetical protein F3Y22_tig00111402pilonHSYRG00971 [Hibiscus syriacus]|uniref:Copine C-terminal domain-containing protein n=1 Tax=Hibiscus syriacus TaxID=106335 RepID=A0A6A2Y519_HIBSY|nr:hypothetical protein F3Y22_tig00111402pilonHSYRG00971 [Hibiscus syriacus]
MRWVIFLLNRSGSSCNFEERSPEEHPIAIRRCDPWTPQHRSTAQINHNPSKPSKPKQSTKEKYRQHIHVSIEGKVSFNNRSLHAIGHTPNPYEQAITIIGKTLAPFDEDNLIPCFGFGPTFYAPVIDAAVDVVENSGGQFHVLVIIADGQAIVLVGVGDGPWEDMKKFDDKIPSREFENFQYKACMELGILGRRTGKAKKVVPRPPPVSYRRPAPPERIPSIASASPAAASDDQQSACPICLTNRKDLAFNCGHTLVSPSFNSSAPVECQKVRQEYEIDLTTFTGIYRYRLGDVVEVSGFHNRTSKQNFICRKKLIWAVNIDKNTEKNLQLVVERGSELLSNHRVEFVDFTSSAEVMRPWSRKRLKKMQRKEMNLKENLLNNLKRPRVALDLDQARDKMSDRDYRVLQWLQALDIQLIGGC